MNALLFFVNCSVNSADFTAPESCSPLPGSQIAATAAAMVCPSTTDFGSKHPCLVSRCCPPSRLFVDYLKSIALGHCLDRLGCWCRRSAAGGIGHACVAPGGAKNLYLAADR